MYEKQIWCELWKLQSISISLIQTSNVFRRVQKPQSDIHHEQWCLHQSNRSSHHRMLKRFFRAVLHAFCILLFFCRFRTSIWMTGVMCSTSDISQSVVPQKDTLFGYFYRKSFLCYIHVWINFYTLDLTWFSWPIDDVCAVAKWHVKWFHRGSAFRVDVACGSISTSSTYTYCNYFIWVFTHPSPNHLLPSLSFRHNHKKHAADQYTSSTSHLHPWA